MAWGSVVEQGRPESERIPRSDLKRACWFGGNTRIWRRAKMVGDLRNKDDPQLRFDADHAAAAAHG
jgi:hypothetical protein